MGVITETVKDVADADVSVKFFLAGNGTLAQRLRVTVSITVDRSDGLPGRYEEITYRVSDADIPTFAPGDAATLRTLLSKIYSAAKADSGT